jgi:putative methyltransferase (TIGR04325 family)
VHPMVWRFFQRPRATTGYGSVEISDLVISKTAAALAAPRIEDIVPADALLPALLAVAITPGERVLDFGGAAGLHYAAAHRAFPERSFRWAVVETAVMAGRAKRFESENLRFFLSPEAAMDWLGGLDLLHSNGTLQYLDDPEAMLARLLNLRPSSILWARVVLEKKRAAKTQVALLSSHGPGPAPERFKDCWITHNITSMERESFLAAHADYRMVWGSVDSFLFVR